MSDKNESQREFNKSQDKYRHDVKEYVGFMKRRKLLMLSALKEYATWLDQEHNGRRYSADAVNRKILAAKSRIRYAFRHSSSAGNEAKARKLEAAMGKVKPRRIRKTATSSESRVSTEEIMKLLTESRERGVKLMVRFLSGTGVELSQMLAIKLADLKAVDEYFFEIRIADKRQTSRLVHIRIDFVEQVRDCFPGTTYLFGRGEKQFSKSAVARQIKHDALSTIGRAVTPGQLRRSWIAAQTQSGRDPRAIVAQVDPIEVDLPATRYSDSEA